MSRSVKVLCVTLIVVLTPPVLPGESCYHGVVRGRVTQKVAEKAKWNGKNDYGERQKQE